MAYIFQTDCVSGMSKVFHEDDVQAS